MRLRRLAISMTAVLVTAASAAVTTDAFAIVRGQEVASAPWAAAVLLTTSTGETGTCSGSIIAPSYVLTARHCLQKGMQVRVGSVQSAAGGEVREVVSRFARYDLLLLKLDRPVDTTYLPLASVDPPYGAIAAIYGWGSTTICNANCPMSPVLKTADVRVFQGDTADWKGGPAINTVFETGYAGIGDSGGPLVYEGKQAGVASVASRDGYQYYSSIADGRDWIRSVTGG